LAGGEHVVTSDIYVDGATLTLKPGTVVRFQEGRGLYIGYHSGYSGATLIAEGTEEKPITFTSAAVSKTPGDWDYIGFYDGTSASSSMEWCIVEYGGGYNDNYGMIHVQETRVAIRNSMIRESEAHGITLNSEGSFEAFSDNTLELNNLSAISIFGNHAHTIGSGNTISGDKGIFVQGDRVERSSVTWLKQTVPYFIQGDLYVGSETGTTLNIEPGTELRVGNSRGIYIGYYSGTFGTLVAEGTAEEKISFTSAAPVGAGSAGDWDIIGFYDGAGNSSSLAYCDFAHGGGYSANFGMIHVSEATIALDHCTITASQTSGITLDDEAKFSSCTGNTFGDNNQFPMEIYGNFAHTIGSGNVFNTGLGILVEGDRVEQAEMTWLDQGVPYIIDGSIYLGSASGAKLVLEAGTSLEFTEGSELYVGYYSNTFGILVADGGGGDEITFTSSAPDGFEAPGDWDGIWFHDGASNGSVLDNCIISFGGGYSSNSGNINVLNDATGIPVISGCRIMNSAKYGIYLGNNAAPTLSDNVFSGNASGDTNL